MLRCGLSWDQEARRKGRMRFSVQRPSARPLAPWYIRLCVSAGRGSDCSVFSPPRSWSGADVSRYAGSTFKGRLAPPKPCERWMRSTGS